MTDVNLSESQGDTLRALLGAPQGLARAQVDGRTFRALAARGFAEDRDGIVHATAQARGLSAGVAAADHSGKPGGLKLSHVQQDLLRSLARNGAMRLGDLDKRTMNALLTRGLARNLGGRLELTDAGRTADRELREPSRNRRGRAEDENPRARAILRAVSALEAAVPQDSELAVGPMFCHIDDLLDGFRRLARRPRQP